MSLIRRSSSLVVILLLVGSAGPASAEDFDMSGQPPAWLVPRYPALTIENGILRCAQPKGHAASFGIPFEATAATVRCRVQLGEAKAINLRFENGFNRHLVRLRLTADSVSLDAINPDALRAKRNTSLASESLRTTSNQWRQLTFAIDHDQVSAQIDHVQISGTIDPSANALTSIIWAIQGATAAIDNVEIKVRSGRVLSKPTFSIAKGAKLVVTDARPDEAVTKTAPTDDAHAKGLFKDYVLPLLKTHCYDCHSHETETAEGGLVLDSKQGWAVGGTLGPSIIAGKPDESWLVKAMLYDNDALQMPPDGRLSDADIAHVQEWIERGAPDFRESDVPHRDKQTGPNRDDLWSVQPLAKPERPDVDNAAWPRQPIDRFVLARLEQEGLRPANDAQPHVIIRRLYDVLSGLPPTVAEQDAFFKAAARDLDDAIATTVDDLLTRRSFGERWGRHWLDIVRYADSPGTSRPRPYAESWRYRNYVIDSFHRDVPFDQLVREQIAGDLQPNATPWDEARGLVATGFLALAHVPAADRDPERIKLDTINEQVDVIGKAFLGISIGCARCHDHKLDPFPTRDYYAMAGIFRSTEANNKTKETLPNLSQSDAANRIPAWMDGGKAGRAYAATEAKAVRDEPIHLRGDVNILGDVVPRGVPTLVASVATPRIPPGSSGREQLCDWLLDSSNPLPARVIANRVWHHAFGSGLVQSTDNFGFTGDAPSHPDLLDDLARRFRDEHGWSFKSLLRELLTSRTWRQSSQADASVMSIDPANRLLARANVRRREAESIIDSIHFVSGRLGRSVPKRTVPDFNVGNQGSTSDLAIDEKTLRTRAVYWPVFRKDTPLAMDVLSIFDFPSATAPRGRRESTNVPAQSLSLLNNTRVLDAARSIAKSLDGPDSERVSLLYRKLFARSATAPEINAALTFLDRFEKTLIAADAAKPTNARAVAWTRLCHTLLCSNEFLVLN